MNAPRLARILVVDDDLHVGRTLVELLALHGFSAERAASGEAALEMLGRESFDLVMLDVRLPGMSGFEACTRVRSQCGASLPILMLTAFGDAASVRHGYEVGADDFLQKPVDTPALILKVRAFLRIKALHDDAVRHEQEAQARARALAQLHEIGRDWSLIAEPEELHRMVTQRLAALIGAPVCAIALYDPATRELAAALPVHGATDEVARGWRYVVKPEYRSLWNFRTGGPYRGNHPLEDPRLLSEVVERAGAESLVLVPMLSEGRFLGLLAAMNKPGGFTDADVQLLSIFAGPAATFLSSREMFGSQVRHASRLERVSALVGEMAATLGRAPLLRLTLSRLRTDLAYDRVAYHAGDGLPVELWSGEPSPDAHPPDPELLRWVARSVRPLTAVDADSQLAVPVRAGEQLLGVLHFLRRRRQAFAPEEVTLLATLAGQLALALQNAEAVARVERLARQMANLYDLGLQTAGLRDLRNLFERATADAGHLIGADHTSVFRLDEDDVLRCFAAWSRAPEAVPEPLPVFRLGEGVTGLAAREGRPMLVNDVQRHPAFIGNAPQMERLVCVPLFYYAQDRRRVLFGVLNATRSVGAPPFTSEELDYLTRFAGQLAIAVANSVAFDAERERSQQLALVNSLLREIAGILSREGIFETTVRRIHEAFRYPVVQCVVPDADTGVNRIEAVASNQTRPEGWANYPISAGITARVLRERKTALVNDVADDPDYFATVPSTRSELMIPIVSGDEVVAILDVQSDQRRAFGPGDVITLETLADGIAILLSNAELYAALQRTNAKLLELDRTKSELVNIVAHDFRSPLGGILGHAELLEWKPDAPRLERLGHARAIVESATHVSRLVEKTLKTNRLETGQLPFEFRVMDLGAVVRQVVARFPDDPQHPIEVELPEDPLPCWADPDRIAEVLENLLSNAIKYSPDGGPVLVEVFREAEHVFVKVTDAGLGIDDRDLDRLFRPFSRLKDERAADIPGSGLGLYICERIMRAHGGRVWARGNGGEGSTFSLSLPLFGVSAQTRPPVVLVATEDERVRREVRRVAEDLGYGVQEVGDGVEAVEAAQRLLPAAVLLDPLLPRLTAVEVAERLKDSARTRRIPLFALAAARDSPEAALFAGWLPKPLDRALLSATLDELPPGLTWSSESA